MAVKRLLLSFFVVIFPARIHGCGINKQLAKPGAAGKR